MDFRMHNGVALPINQWIATKMCSLSAIPFLLQKFQFFFSLCNGFNDLDWYSFLTVSSRQWLRWRRRRLRKRIWIYIKCFAQRTLERCWCCDEATQQKLHDFLMITKHNGSLWGKWRIHILQLLRKRWATRWDEKWKNLLMMEICKYNFQNYRNFKSGSGKWQVATCQKIIYIFPSILCCMCERTTCAIESTLHSYRTYDTSIQSLHRQRFEL